MEVLRIEDGGRIAEDGRLKVGDQITEINEHPCSEVCILTKIDTVGALQNSIES